jgi:hypothetical protein
MSWKSQQNYALGFSLNFATEASQNHDSGDNVVIYTSPPLPIGTWLIIVNGVNIPIGATTQSFLGIYSGALPDPVASINIDADVIQFPSLISAFKSDGTTTFTIDVMCDTSAGTFDIDAGSVQMVKLTNV